MPIAYYCLQPPRFAYDLMKETAEANGVLGLFVPLVARPYRWLDRRLAPNCDRLFAISKDYAEWCHELYRPPVLDLVYPGIDPDKALAADPLAARRSLRVDSETPLVVTANKLIVRKNIDIFLHAMRTVVDRVPLARGVVVGDGPMREPLLALRDRLGLREKVIFTGFVPHFRDVVNFLAASDVYVFLERFVPFGLTVLEAGSCGRPVVAVRGGGTRDTVLDGETGFLVDDQPIRPGEVAEKICRLLEDRDLGARMGRRGVENAHQFSFKKTAARFIDILQLMAEDRS